MAKRLALIDPQLLMDLLRGSRDPSLPPDPRLTELSNLERATEQTLKQPDSHENLAKVNTFLARYKDMHDAGAAPPPKTAPPPLNHLLETDTLDSLPPTLRRKGANAITFLRKHFTFAEDGTVVLNNERIENLPLMDLVHGLVRDRKQWSATPQFESAFRHLVRVGIPESLVHNKHLLDLPPSPRPAGYYDSDTTPPRPTKRARIGKRQNWNTLSQAYHNDDA